MERLRSRFPTPIEGSHRVFAHRPTLPDLSCDKRQWLQQQGRLDRKSCQGCRSLIHKLMNRLRFGPGPRKPVVMSTAERAAPTHRGLAHHKGC